MSDKPNVIRDTDREAVRLAKSLVRSARYAAIAVLDPSDGSPAVSRVGVATDLDGSPIILISGLASHTQALRADPRCSILLGEPGKGDALAHPRISVACRAIFIEPGAPDEARLRRRYLNRNPKASLYADLGDFRFCLLEALGANLNGGFGRAYRLTASDLTTEIPSGLADSEQGAVDHMNEDHLDAIQLYAEHFGKLAGDGWRLSGLDADGLDLINGDRVGRVFYPSPLTSAAQLRSTLVDMAKTARQTT